MMGRSCRWTQESSECYISSFSFDASLAIVTRRLLFNTESSRGGVGASPSPLQHPRPLTERCVSDNQLPPRPLVATKPPPPPSRLPALRRPPTTSTGAPRRVKHGALYSRKGACPHRTSGPFNGRPQAGIRPPLLGLRRVLQHRHANISSGRPKWKTQTRNIEISSARARAKESKGGGQWRKKIEGKPSLECTHAHMHTGG